MSIQNHPNFHAVNFATAVVSLWYEKRTKSQFGWQVGDDQKILDYFWSSLRGKANRTTTAQDTPAVLGFISEFKKKNSVDGDAIADLCDKLEDIVDEGVR